MKKERLVLLIGIISFILLMLALVFSAGVGIIITKPLNQSYNYINHTLNVTTSTTASSCRYVFNASVQGQKWTQLTSSAGWAARYGHVIAVAPNGTIWLTGGFDNGATYYNDVWYSTDGNTWVQATASANFESRYGHGFVIKSDGSLWIMGGVNSGGYKLNDVWNSTDGTVWTLVNSSVAWENRSLLQAVITSDDVMWVMGGQNDSGSGYILGDVWNSSNGINWQLVNSSAFLGRREFDTVTGTNNRLWVMGGWAESGSYLNDVWYSDNGLTWQAPNASSAIPWGLRKSHASAFTPSDGRIWVSGGYNPDTAGYRNDVWYSQDGANWTQAVSASDWTQRQDHQMVIMKNGTIIIAGGYYGANLNDVWKSSTPVTMDAGIPNGVKPWGKTFNASEGSNFIGVECNDSTNLWNGTNVSFYVDTALPVLTISNPLNTTYNASAQPVAANVTVSESASACLSSLNGAANLTMNGSGTEWGITLTFAESSNRVVISCNDTLNNWNTTQVTFFIDSIKPVLNITSPLNATYATTLITANVTTNESASSCKYSLNTHGIDENWTTLNSSAFTGRYGHSMVNTSDGTMWIIGGAYDEMGFTTYINSVWNSTDGINWVLVNSSPAFSPRVYHTSVVDSTGKMWVIAGYNETFLNDTWYSTDGANWVLANISAFPARYGHTSVVDSSGKIWVIGGLIPTAGTDPPIVQVFGDVSISAGGGGTPVVTNTTWYSTDGYAWIQANASAFPPRYLHSSFVSSDGKIWVIGGLYTTGPGTNIGYNDTWYSNDSASWVRVTNSGAFVERYKHASVATPDGRIWLLGGTDAAGTEYNDVWYSTNGSDWALANSTSVWSARSGHSALYLNNAIYLIGGRDAYTQGKNDTYKTSPIPARYYTMSGSGTVWWNNFTATQGSNDIKTKCYDIAGNLNSSMQWFYVDSLGPVITISSPLNQSYTAASTTLTVSLSESASTCVYSLNGAANVTMTGSGTSWSSTLTAISGGNTIVVSCRDALSNWNSTSVAFSVTISSSSTEGTTTGGGTSGGLSSGQNQAEFSNVKPGETAEKQITDKNTALTKISITPDSYMDKAKLVVEKKVALPQNTKEPNGKIYELMDIKLDTDIPVKAEICFSVKEEWLEENNAVKENIVLAHYNPKVVYTLSPNTISEKELTVSFVAEEEEWEELPTEIVQEEPLIEDSKVDYCAEAKDFSMYAIIEKSPKEIEFFTELKPLVEAQIITSMAVQEERGVDWWAFRNWIMGSIDIILIMLVFITLMFGNRIFPEGISIPYVAERQLPPLEGILAAPKAEEPMLPFAPELSVELPKPPAKEELPLAYKKTLLGFARDSLLQGYSENEIIEKMAEYGIDKGDISKIMKESHIKICAMSKDELLPHVLEAVMHGHSFDEISLYFAKRGISFDCIVSVVKMARHEISKSSGKILLPFVKKCLSDRVPAETTIAMLMKHGVNKSAAEKLIINARYRMKRHLK